MTNYLPSIRNAVRAFIVRDGKVLLLHKQNEQQAKYYGLPGGGQDVGENLLAALQRECLEEIATRVEVMDLLFVADYFKEKLIDLPVTRHLVEFIFKCHVSDHYIATSGEKPDKHQIGVVWVAFNELSNIALLPKDLAVLLANDSARSVYLGSIQ